MKYPPARLGLHRPHNLGGARLFLVVSFLPLLSLSLFAFPDVPISDDTSTVVIEDAPDQDVIVFGKTLTIKKSAKSALVVGGEIIVEGSVKEDVVAIGGNILQTEGAYIGGNVLVFGGSFKTEGQSPLRVANKQTVTIGAFEEELRNLGQNPSQILSPGFSLRFLGQRIVVALFWFVISIVAATIAPGAISRSVARVRLMPLKVCSLGAGALILIASLIIGAAFVLPDYLGATLALMGLLLLILIYVYGRIALQVSAGKLFQKHFLSQNNRSETLAVLIGVLAWTLLLSLPYVWLIALFLVFAAGMGLILTGRAANKWQNL